MANRKERPHLSQYSSLQVARLHYPPSIPNVLKSNATEQFAKVNVKLGAKTTAAADASAINKLFPLTYGQSIVDISRGTSYEPGEELKVGVVLSGGQAAGGHNAICGLYDFLVARNAKNKLFGFLNGPIGIIKGNYIELTGDIVSHYRNQGGFDIIGSGRDKIESKEQLQSSKENVVKLGLDGLVVIGGDDSNTNAAVLAEYFRAQNIKTCVIGLPKTIDGDLKTDLVEVSFGFDTACKVYANLIGNIATDCVSAAKYYHFIRLMGRSASHITLECALLTHPNAALIGEEVAEKKMTLGQITKQLADMVCARAANSKNYGIVLVPEGLIEFVPEVHALISEINELLAKSVAVNDVRSQLSHSSQALFDFLPKSIREELLFDRDPHGNAQVSKIETEKVLIYLLTDELKKRKTAGNFKGNFNALNHLFGYEGRCSLPSNFDSNYCYALGRAAGALLEHRLTGYMAVIRNLVAPPSDWLVGGLPLTSLMNVERRHGKDKPVIRKALVELDKKPFKVFASNREKWAQGDHFTNPGPIQFSGAAAEVLNKTLELEHGAHYVASAL